MLILVSSVGRNEKHLVNCGWEGLHICGCRADPRSTYTSPLNSSLFFSATSVSSIISFFLRPEDLPSWQALFRFRNRHRILSGRGFSSNNIIEIHFFKSFFKTESLLGETRRLWLQWPGYLTAPPVEVSFSHICASLSLSLKIVTRKL